MTEDNTLLVTIKADVAPFHKAMRKIQKILTGPEFKRRGVQVRFDYHDLWIGTFWTRTRWPWLVSDPQGWRIDVYICIIPCLPIRIWWGDPGVQTYRA